MADSSDNVDEDEMLILLVQGKNFLYDKSDRQYKDVQKKNEAWNEIASDLYHLTGRPMEVKQMINKWRNLKTKYTAERRKVSEYIPSGSAAPATTSQWKYYGCMNFLAKHVQHRRTCSNFQSPAAGDRDTSSDEDSGDDVVVVGEESEDFVDRLEDEDADVPMSVPTPSSSTALTGPNNHLLVLRDAWTKIPEENRLACYTELILVVRNKRRQLQPNPQSLNARR